MLKKILSKLILCVEMENWEKAEGFADTVKQLTAEAPREAKSAALRLKMAIQKENYEKTAAAFETLNALMIGAFSLFTFHGNRAAHQFYQLLADIQPKPCSSILSGNGSIYL